MSVSVLPEGDRGAPGSISSWIKAAITQCYVYAKQRHDFDVSIRAHQVRGLAATWAAKGNVSMNQLSKSQNTFTSHYLKDVWTDKDGTFSIGHLVAAQKVVPS